MGARKNAARRGNAYVARGARVLGISMAASAGAWLGCNAILGNEPGVLKGPDADADADAGADGAGSDGDVVCQSTTYPPPPDDMVVNGGMIDFSVAIRTIDLGENATKDASIGIDLDNLCTCLGEGASCKYPPYATADHCDDKGGVDNASARLMAVLVGFLGPSKFGSAFYTDEAEKGSWTLLARVSGYNGMPDDPKVRFALYSPQGLEPNPMNADGGAAMTCFGAADGGPPPPQIPCWNGADLWRVAQSSITPGGTVDNPVYVDDNAYVSEGVLVANMSDMTISLRSGIENHLAIKLTAGTILGTLVNPGDGFGWRIEAGVMAGRWKTMDLFAGLSTFTAQGQTVCTNDTLSYPIVKTRICEFVDISSKLGGSTLECDSLSFGMGFSAFPVKLGSIVQTQPPVSNCPPEADPALDNCDK